MSQDPRALLQKAQKVLQSASGGFSFFGGREDKYQEAADLYTQAANAFKMQKQNIEAGKAFEEAARVHTEKLKEPDDAANCMLDAYKAYRKDDPTAAVRCLNVAIDRYCAKGNFRRAATQKEHLGELLEETGDIKGAIEAYEAAAGWFDDDNAKALASKNWLKVADIAAPAGDLYKSIEIWERYAREAVEGGNANQRFNLNGWLWKAGICHLVAGDIVGAHRALDSYAQLDPQFMKEREGRTLAEMVAAVESKSMEAFQDALGDFDRFRQLKNWETALLVKVKDQLEGEEEDDAFA